MCNVNIHHPAKLLLRAVYQTSANYQFTAQDVFIRKKPHLDRGAGETRAIHHSHTPRYYFSTILYLSLYLPSIIRASPKLILVLQRSITTSAKPTESSRPASFPLSSSMARIPRTYGKLPRFVYPPTPKNRPRWRLVVGVAEK